MNQIGNLLARPRLYRNVDGLVELGGSVMCLGNALILWLLRRSPVDSVWHQISFFVLVGLALLIRYGTKAVKERITYPRTGFVAYRRPWQRSAFAAAVAALVAAGLAAAFRRHWDISILASLTGLVFAAVYVHNFVGAVRWKWVIAGAMAVASLVITFLTTDGLGTPGIDSSVAGQDRARLYETVLLCFLAYGTMLLISGGISLWLYLRHTQAATRGDQ